MNLRILCCSLVLVLVCCLHAGNGASISSLVKSEQTRNVDKFELHRVARQAVDDDSNEEDEEEAELQAQQLQQQQQQQQNVDDSEEDSEEDPAADEDNDDDDDEDDDDEYRRRRRRRRETNEASSAAPNAVDQDKEVEPLVAPALAPEVATEAAIKDPESEPETSTSTSSVTDVAAASTPAPPSRKTSVLVLIRDALKKVTTELPTEQVATNALQYFQLFEHFIQQTIEQVIGDDDDDEEETTAAAIAETANENAPVFDGNKEENSTDLPAAINEPAKPTDAAETTPAPVQAPPAEA